MKQTFNKIFFDFYFKKYDVTAYLQHDAWSHYV